MNPVSLPKADLLVQGGLVLTCVGREGDAVGRLPSGAVACAGERILAVSSRAEIASQVDLTGARVFDPTGCIVAPGFVDRHTHLIFGGSRAQEYAAHLTHNAAEVRAMGIPSGIQATVAMTRAATIDELTSSAAARLGRMFWSGTTTAEVKSGYGLTVADEIKMLEVGRQLARTSPVDVLNTFLGAHDFPPELPRGRYVEMVIHEMLPEVVERGLAEFCDVYLDTGYYTVAERSPHPGTWQPGRCATRPQIPGL